MDLAKPKSGALVSLFSSPSLYRIKAVIKTLQHRLRRVSSRRLSSEGGNRVGEGGGELTRSETWRRCSYNLQSE